MKSQERHHLKQNEFAVTASRVAGVVRENRSQVGMIGGAIVLILVIGGGYFTIQRRAENQASALLGAALAIQNSPIVPAPTVPGAKQQQGTYPTELARGEAALAAFQKIIDTYGNKESGLAAKYYSGGVLMSLNRAADADRVFGEVAANAGSSIYGPLAQLGRAQALSGLGKFDDAIRILTDLSGQRDGALPVDGVLIELARTCDRAGKVQEARAAYKRVVDEFSQSGYVGEARQRLAAG